LETTLHVVEGAEIVEKRPRRGGRHQALWRQL